MNLFATRRATAEDAPQPQRSPFMVSAASIAGAEHLRLQRNNQDGVAVYQDPSAIVAVVCDGCSAGRYSEVGSRLGARYMASWLSANIEAELDARLLAELTGSTLAFLLTIARSLDGRQHGIAQPIADYLLYAFIAAVVKEERTVIFGIGDGAFSVNGQVHHLDPGPKNAPPYLSYRLVPTKTDYTQGDLRSTIYWAGASATIESLFIGSDGLSAPCFNDESDAQNELLRFEGQDRFVINPSLLQKRLVALAQHHPIHDDTTMVLLRRDHRPFSEVQK